MNESKPSGPIGAVTDLGRDIGEYIRVQRNSAKVSLRQLAKLTGVSNPYLSQIERGLRKPSAEILQQIAKGLRISAEALYVQAGILEAPAGGPLVDAIHAAAELTERQKQVLLDVYESFLRANGTDAGGVSGTDVNGPDATDTNGPGVANTDIAGGADANGHGGSGTDVDVDDVDAGTTA